MIEAEKYFKPYSRKKVKISDVGNDLDEIRRKRWNLDKIGVSHQKGPKHVENPFSNLQIMKKEYNFENYQ